MKQISSQGGFSLIELLVAVLVIVMLTTVVGLNVGSGGADLRLDNEVRQFAATLGYAQTEAEFSGADHGLFIERGIEDGEDRYRGHWLRRFDQGWSDPRGSTEVLAPFWFSEGVELQLILDGQPPIELLPRDPELNPAPQLVLFAGGEVVPGELDWVDWRTGDLIYRLRWDLFGRTTLMPRGIEPEDDPL